jgi:hypothetical protein
MAFSTDITLTGTAAATYTYSQISLEGAKSIRKDSTRDLGTPRSMVISHSVSGKGMTAVDRHLVRLNLVEEDTGSEEIATVGSSVYVVIEAPRRIVTSAMLQDQVDQMVDFLTTEGNLDKLLNSEP